MKMEATSYRLLRLVKKYPRQFDAAILILGFIIGANLFIFFKRSGLDDISLTHVFSNYGFHFITPTLAGLTIGAAFFTLEFNLFKRLNRQSRALVLLIKFILTSFIILLNLFALAIFVNILLNGERFDQSIYKAMSFVTSEVFFSLYVYLMILSIALNFFKALGNQFGHGIIINYLLGKYRVPVEEHRVFMFLDLNNSTSIAELLGHVKYSRFINKCFHDLSELLPQYDAEVYQYVGDEAVITWRTKHLENPLQPLLLFEANENFIHKQQENYLNKFGVIPSFKASINAGVVSVTMVGSRRKEMAFHGDVLNTAARVLNHCKQLKKKVLITDAFSKLLKANEGVNTIYLKDIFLRGKHEKTAIYQPYLVNPTLKG